MREDSRGRLFRNAVAAESPLQVVGTITAYTARMAQATGYRAIYLSGGGVAANSLGMPDLGISTLDDVITDAQRITEACSLPSWSISTPVGVGHLTSHAPSAI